MSPFAKTFADARTATEAVRRSVALRQQAVRTPRAAAKGATVTFDRIAGSSGLPLVGRPIERWLAPLASLHVCALDRLPQFDPLRRIIPRIDLLTDSALRTALGRLAQTGPTGTALIHGDFHLGQVICDTHDQAWLIDLDDLAIGPAEADIGNLIANLATQDHLPGPFSVRIKNWRKDVLGMWARMGQTANSAKVDHFTALALIRRHLKLREHARRDFEAEIAAWITPVAYRTSPSDSAAYHG